MRAGVRIAAGRAGRLEIGARYVSGVLAAEEPVYFAGTLLTWGAIGEEVQRLFSFEERHRRLLARLVLRSRYAGLLTG